VRRTPLGGAAAWRGAEVRGRRDWIVELDAAAVAEIGAAVAAVRRRGLAMGQVSRDFPPPPSGRRSPGGFASCATGAASCCSAACR
jgi:hypothetical protein